MQLLMELNHAQKADAHERIAQSPVRGGRSGNLQMLLNHRARATWMWRSVMRLPFRKKFSMGTSVASQLRVYPAFAAMSVKSRYAARPTINTESCKHQLLPLMHCYDVDSPAHSSCSHCASCTPPKPPAHQNGYACDNSSNAGLVLQHAIANVACSRIRSLLHSKEPEEGRLCDSNGKGLPLRMRADRT